MPPKCKSSPPSGRSGAGSSGGSSPCPKCCGCVTRVAIQNVQMFTKPAIFRGGAWVSNGHSFDFVIDMSFTGGSGGTSDCNLEWWEKVDGLGIGQTANTWTEMLKFAPTSPTFDPWNNRVVPCPGGGNLTVTIVDIPSLGDQSPSFSADRTLEFRLMIKSGGGCGCAHGCLMAKAKQVLTMVNGALVAAKCSFKIL
jgi:hypothetical protein